MAENIVKLLYIMAGFMIMLMGLSSFFEHHRQYTRYEQSVRTSQEEKHTWFIEKADKRQDEPVNILTYQELLAEVGGYYCFSKDLIISTEEEVYTKNQTGEGFQEFINAFDTHSIYSLNVTSDKGALRETIFLEIREIKE